MVISSMSALQLHLLLIHSLLIPQVGPHHTHMLHSCTLSHYIYIHTLKQNYGHTGEHICLNAIEHACPQHAAKSHLWVIHACIVFMYTLYSGMPCPYMHDLCFTDVSSSSTNHAVRGLILVQHHHSWPQGATDSPRSTGVTFYALQKRTRGTL